MSIRLLGLSVISLLGLLFLAGCGADATSTPVPTRPPAAATATTAAPTAVPTAVMAKPEGDLVVLIDNLRGSASVGAMSHSGSRLQGIFHNVGETPIRATAVQGELLGNLAERWEISPDGRQLTYHVRQGVQFHDGWGEVTSADFKWSAEEAVLPGTKYNMSGDWRGIEKIETPDKYTIVFTVPVGRALTVLHASHVYLGVGISSFNYWNSVDESEFRTKWIGSGPFKFVAASEDEFVKLTANEDHWGYVPHFKNVEYKAVPESASQIAAFRAGEADIAQVNPALLAEIRAANIRIVEGPGGKFLNISFGGNWLPERIAPDVGCDEMFNATCGEFNPDIPFVEDPSDPQGFEKAAKVRLAMLVAIDRNEIIDTIFGGFPAKTGATGIIPGGSYDGPYFVPRPYDPALAKQLLAEAGYANGFEVTYHAEKRDAGDLLAQAVAPYWEAIGLDVKISSGVDTRALKVNRTFGTDKPEVLNQFGLSSFTEYFVWGGLTVSDDDNPVGGEHPFIDEQVNRLGTIFDDAARRLASIEVGKFWYDNTWAIPVGHLPLLLMASDKIGDYPYPFGDRYFGYVELVTRAN